jgi:hypothetical protein
LADEVVLLRKFAAAALCAMTVLGHAYVIGAARQRSNGRVPAMIEIYPLGDNDTRAHKERAGIPSVGRVHRRGDLMSNALSVFQGPQNLSAAERAISVIAGLGLAAAATKPRPNPVLNIAALLGGAYLAIRGATGRCPIKQALQSMPMTMVPAEAKAPARRSRAARR